MGTNETLGRGEWLFIKKDGNSWVSDTYYLDPLGQRGRISHFEITYWGYHDESDYEEYDRFCSVGELTSRLSSDQAALDKIRRIMQLDRTEMRKLVETSGVRE